jgi:hypothetical protein
LANRFETPFAPAARRGSAGEEREAQRQPASGAKHDNAPR